MKHNELPGMKAPYKLDAGEGLRYAFGSHLATLVAREQDIGVPMAGAILTGAKGASFPVHRHARSHEAFIVVEGAVSLILGEQTFLLFPGDYVNVPPGTPHGWSYLDHHGKLYGWAFNGNANQMYERIGEPFAGKVYRESSEEPDWNKLDASVDTELVSGHATSLPYAEKRNALPEGNVPYVLAGGEGDRLLAADQLFTFLGDQRHSGGVFMTIMNEGAMGDPIPAHYHEHVTETFFCMSGALKMFVDGEYVTLYPGDYVHVPPKAVHSYQIVRNDTRFLGYLNPGSFDSFFRYLGVPYAGYIYPLVPPPFDFSRVLQHLGELDLKLMGKPGAPPAQGRT
jgi:quercetin 2,3-dioxygenase